MRKRYQRRLLTALGYRPFEASEEQRRQVRILAFNNTPHERIAHIMEMPLVILQYAFARDLDLATDSIVHTLSERMLELATQQRDLPVAYRATELVLKTRSKAWRIPTDVVDHGKPVESMNLTEVDNAIARVQREIRDAAAAADAQATTADVEG
jgi:hypothetical protein